jgi:hypothetical protein
LSTVKSARASSKRSGFGKAAAGGLAAKNEDGGMQNRYVRCDWNRGGPADDKISIC